MAERARAVLRVEPETIPQLRALLEECIGLLEVKVYGLQRGGRVEDPWMHDPVSLRMQELYNASVMEAADGGYAALRAYQAELQRTYEALGRMEEEYHRTEGMNEGLFGGRS